jgi:hypothetical protein
VAPLLLVVAPLFCVVGLMTFFGVEASFFLAHPQAISFNRF